MSEPKPAAEDVLPAEGTAVEVGGIDAGTGTDDAERVLDLPLFHQVPDQESSVSVNLPEPDLQESDSLSSSTEAGADGSSQAVTSQAGGGQPEPDLRSIGQADITVLSRLPEAPVIVVPMPDPVLPVLPDPLPPPAAIPVPEAAQTMVPADPAAAKDKAAPETASTAEEDAGVSTTVTEPESMPVPKDSLVLPVSPSSSARSVDTVPVAIPETRVEVARGQRFELRLRGSGWTFLGDEDGKDGVRYETRRFEDNHAVFVMNPARVGEYLLRFQRQDPLELRTEASLVRLLVNPAPTLGLQGAGPSPMASFVVASAGSPAAESATASGAATADGSATIPGTVSTPAFPTPETAVLVGEALGGSSIRDSLPPAGSATLPNISGTGSTSAATVSPSAASATPSASSASTPATTPAVAASATQAAGQPAASASSPAATSAQAAGQPPAQPASQPSSQPAASSLSDPAALIKLARDELSAKRVSVAMEALDRYKSLFPYAGDEVFYLYALAYEQDTPLRDIKKAYENYRRVRDEFPRSQFWRQSADRTIYLERHYPGLR
ncbi:MAG: hypothetical protein AB7T74_05385 [Clostridia bacterium]